jgi:hypothetical protein
LFSPKIKRANQATAQEFHLASRNQIAFESAAMFDQVEHQSAEIIE